MYLSGTIVTPYSVYSNNRGETDGNTATLKKIFWKDKVHVMNSAESLRHALRVRLAELGATCNYQYDRNSLEVKYDGAPPEGEKASKKAEKVKFDETKYWDDDIFGYMSPVLKEGANCRRGPLEISPGISFETADKMFFNFNAKSGNKDSNSLYSSEAIATRLQWGFCVNVDNITDPSRALKLLEAIFTIHGVGGSHGRFHYDFAPESAVFRWSENPFPGILYCFQKANNDAGVLAPNLVGKVGMDIPGEELWVTGEYAKTHEGENLMDENATVSPSLKETLASLTDIISTHIN